VSVREIRTRPSSSAAANVSLSGANAAATTVVPTVRCFSHSAVPGLPRHSAGGPLPPHVSAWRPSGAAAAPNAMVGAVGAPAAAEKGGPSTPPPRLSLTRMIRAN
jgi:hypothetical protein